MKNDELVKIGDKGRKVKNPNNARFRPEDIPPEDNRRFITNSMQVAALPKIDTTDAEQVQNRITEYFTISINNGVKPSFVGLALALGVDRRRLYEWLHGLIKMPADVVEAVKKAVTTLNMQMEDYMQNGQINPVSGIFLMKNNLGYRDQAEVVVTPNNPLGDIDKEGLEQRYIDSIPEAIESDCKEIK